MPAITGLYEQKLAVSFKAPFNTRKSDIDDGFHKLVIATRQLLQLN